MMDSDNQSMRELLHTVLRTQLVILAELSSLTGRSVSASLDRHDVILRELTQSMRGKDGATQTE